MLSRINALTFSRFVVLGRSGTVSYSTQPLAIVTGAAQGIGFCISDRLIREGYGVCLADVNEDKGKECLAKLQKKYGAERALFQTCDVTSEASFRQTFSRVQELGPVSLLVNNAAIVDEYDVEAMVAVNLVGTIIGCQLALQFMGTKAGGKGGTVINLGSIRSFLAYPNTPAYVATKHGVLGLTRSYGDETHFKQNGVLFTAVCPLFINTPVVYSAKVLDVLKYEPVMFLEPEFVADGVLKVLTDRINGSALLLLQKEMKYVAIRDQMKKIPFSR